MRLRNRHEPNSVFHAKLFLAASPFAYLFSSVMAAGLWLDVAPGAGEVGQLIGGLAPNAAWFIYFVRSARVRNTYRLKASQEPLASAP